MKKDSSSLWVIRLGKSNGMGEIRELFHLQLIETLIIF